MASEGNVKKIFLTPPESFPFPFPPYSIQEEFMKHLYSALEEQKLGIFESPTGTGKSMSIICGALRWLQDHETQKITALELQIEELEQQSKCIDHSGGDWITQQARSSECIHSKWGFQQKLNKLKEYHQKMEEMKMNVNKIRENEKRKYISKKNSNQDYVKMKNESNGIDKGKEDYKTDNVEDGGGDEDHDILLHDSDMYCFEENEKETCESDGEDNAKEDNNKCTKIIVCSRTHSQLSQFIGEIERSPYNNFRVIPLASRQSYCVNSVVRKLKSLTLMNERCTDLQRGGKGKSTKTNSDGETIKKSKTSSSCPYLQSQQAVQQLSEEALTRVQDMESLFTRGTHLHACPYYATRKAVADAQVVVVPYNILLHKSTREACGLSLKDNVVIIDEAHNLLDTIANVYSARVMGNQLIQAHGLLKQYLGKYEKLFSAMNVLYLTQLIFVTGNLIKLIGGKPGYKPETNNQKTEEDTKLYTLPDLVTAAEIDNINLYRLLAFCKNSKIANKLQGFSARHSSVEINNKPRPKTGIQAFLKEISKQNVPTNEADTQDKDQIEENGSTNPLLPIIGFLETLVNPCEDGRIVCSRQSVTGKGSLKFLLLNPASHFSEIVREARSVIVAGGTMQPISEFRDQLFVSAGASLSQITEFSCGHVIPPENILPIVCTKDFLGNTFDFSYTKRNTVAMLNSLEKLIRTACNIVPGGVVCFFPSYDYEATVFRHLEKSNTIEKMSLKKKIFREPKNSSDVDKVLQEFAKAVAKGKTAGHKTNGAFLFSVVGGKLSEGLNFSDDLGRCIIVVGLPYPNIKSPELQEKMQYLNTHVSHDAGQQHYENLCMKAVNQCIGRAVRHRYDYASVLLVDHRYAKPHIQKLLPKWILSSLKTDFSACQDSFGWIVKFFTYKRKGSCSV